MKTGGTQNLAQPIPSHWKQAFLFRLADGKPVLIRPVLPEDKERLAAGVAAMSGNSRYLRFFTGTTQLSPEQLAYFTEVDQENHVAWCALDPATPEFRGLGLGRFVRSAEDPSIAEWALAVIDPMQGRGLGTVLLAMLHIQARRLGIRILRGLVLPENQPVIDWMTDLGAMVHYGLEVHRVDLPVCDEASPAETRAAERLHRTMAQLAEAMKS